MSDPYGNIRTYLQENQANLGHIAGRALVGKGELQEIVDGGEISEDIALALATVTEPTDDCWALDPDDPEFEKVPNLSNQQIVERLRFAQSEGKLALVANVAGVKGGVATLEEICNRGGRLDPVTRSLLLNVMSEEE